MTWLTAALGPKGQITLPKRVREMLGMRETGDVVGFILDDEKGSVRLTRMEIRPADENYTEEEFRKLEKLAKSPGGKRFKSAKEFLQHVNKL